MIGDLPGCRSMLTRPLRSSSRRTRHLVLRASPKPSALLFDSAMGAPFLLQFKYARCSASLQVCPEAPSRSFNHGNGTWMKCPRRRRLGATPVSTVSTSMRRPWWTTTRVMPRPASVRLLRRPARRALYPHLDRHRARVAIAGAALQHLVDRNPDLEPVADVAAGLQHDLLSVLDPLLVRFLEKDAVMHEHDRHDAGLAQA